MVIPANAITANAGGTTSEDREEERQNNAANRLPLPVGFQNFERERDAAEKQERESGARKKTPKPVENETPAHDEQKSTTSSKKSSKRGSKAKSKASSILSEQVDKEMRENLALEETRNEENKAHTEAELAELYGKIKDIEMQQKIDEQLHEKKKEKIKEVANELHAIIDNAEEENRSETSSVIRLGDDSHEDRVNLEMTAAGATFGGAKPDALTSVWAKGAAKMTSTAKKDVKPLDPFHLPRKNLPGPPRKTNRKIDYGAKVKEEKDDKPIHFSIPHHGLKSPKPKKKEEMKQNAGKEEGKKPAGAKTVDVKATGDNRVRTGTTKEHPPPSPSGSSTSSNASSTKNDEEESSIDSKPTGVLATIMKLQQQQLEAALRQGAINQLKEMRPNKKFSGASNKKMDFEKHKKMFEEIMEIPGVTKKQVLNEFQHWFEGSAFKLVEAETLKQDAETAVDEALERLTKKFGMRRDTALEMLDEVLQGKTIDEKDHNGLLDFYAKLTSVHSLACETDKGSDFENKLVVKTIIEKKLPHMKVKWARKAVKYKLANKSEMSFAQFLEYIDEEHTISEMLSRYSGGSSYNKPTANAKVSTTTANPAAKKESSSAPTKKPATGNCPRCDAGHKLDACSIFSEMTSPDRRKFMKNQGLCFRCMSSGHMAKACDSGIKCDQCDIPHHPMLHPTPGETKQPNSEAAGAKTESATA